MYKYAGIGSRETPLEVLNTMTKIARYLKSNSWVLRSGAAIGADKAFEKGAGKAVEIFTARSNIPEEAFDLAEKHHPAWHHCNEFARRLHARNGMILLGQDLNDPVNFVVCWTKDGKDTGGTGQAIRIATEMKIPIFNLYYLDAQSKLSYYLRSLNE